MSHALRLFGTEERPSEGRRIRAGRLSATLQEGNLRHVRFDGIEIIRAVSCVVRDHEWGTTASVIDQLRIDEAADRFHVSYTAVCRIGDQCVRYEADIEGSERTLRFRMRAHAETDFLTARLGFVVLHPITGVAGEEVDILHVDGSVERARFPDLIEPYQPFRDIRALTHAARPGLSVTCRMEGDTFETEDQRNWSDASYKTYVRPIGLPWPYRLEAGTVLEQSVALAIEGEPQEGHARETIPTVTLGSPAGRLPAIGLHLEPGRMPSPPAMSLLRTLRPGFLLARHDGRTRDLEALAQAHTLATSLDAALHLEAVLPGLDVVAEARALADDVANIGAAVDMVVAIPAADLKGTLPGSEWPACPPLADVYRAVRTALPSIRLVGGTPNFFTELNRKRPPVDQLDAVTFSISAIVHAADDITVMENLEALPAIFRSAEAMAQGRPIVLGPSQIGCRDNPYGQAASPNPDGIRKAMTDDDPRQRGHFAAAWTVGFLARCVGTAVSHVAIGSPVGRFGVLHDDIDGRSEQDAVRPVYDVLRAVGEAGRAEAVVASSSAPNRIAGVAWREDQAVHLLLANLTGEMLEMLVEHGRDQTTISLDPFETRRLALSH